MKEHRESLRGRDVRLLGIRCSAFRGAANDLEKGQTKLTFGADSAAGSSAGTSPGTAAGDDSRPRSFHRKDNQQKNNSSASSLERMQADALRRGIVDEAVLSELPAHIRAELKQSSSGSTSATSSPIVSSLRRAGANAIVSEIGGGPTKKRKRDASETSDLPNDQARALRSGNVDVAFLAELPPDIRRELESSLMRPPPAKKRTKAGAKKKKEKKRGRISSFFVRRP